MIVEGKLVTRNVKRKTKKKGVVVSESVFLYIPKVVLKNIGYDKNKHKKYKIWLEGKTINMEFVEGEK